MKAIIEGFGSIVEILHYSGVPTSLESLCFWGIILDGARFPPSTTYLLLV